jgi:hypothetical protein
MFHGSALHHRQKLSAGIADELGGSAIQALGVIALDQIRCQAVIFSGRNAAATKGSRIMSEICRRLTVIRNSDAVSRGAQRARFAWFDICCLHRIFKEKDARSLDREL